MRGDRAWLVEGLVLLALLTVVALHAGAPITCTDFHWHLKLGQLIDATGSIPRVDTFSAVHPNAPYVQPQWLWEWLAARVYSLGGLRGIRIAQAFMLVASFAWLYRNARHLGLRAASATLLTVLAFTFFEDRFRARPDGMTLGFVALSLPLLSWDGVARSKAVSAWTFALSVLWANVHGGASVLFLLSMLALCTGAVIDSKRQGKPWPRFALQQVAAVALGMLCSPTLIQGLMHWASLIGTQLDTGNEEWMPTYTVLRQAVTPCTLLIALGPLVIAVCYAIEQYKLTRRTGLAPGRLGEWFLCAGYLLLSYQAIRNSFLCLVPLLFMLQRASQQPGVRFGRLMTVLTLAVALVTGHDVLERSYGGLAHASDIYRYDELPDTYPTEVADFLAEAGIEGGIFNDPKWGGYLIFRGYPRNHVFVDSRQNFTSEMWDLFLATLSVRTRTAALDTAMKRWGVELAVFRGPTFALGTAAPGWQLLYRSGDQEVHQHLAGAHAAQNLARARAFLRKQAPGLSGLNQTELALRVGARLWLQKPAQQAAIAQSKVRIASNQRQAQWQGHLELAELYYRAGLCEPSLSALDEAIRRSPLAPRHLYVDAMCAYATANMSRVRERLSQLRQLGVTTLTARQRERLDLLLQASAP